MTIDNNPMTDEEIENRARLGYEARCTYLNYVPAWHALSDEEREAEIQGAIAVLGQRGA